MVCEEPDELLDVSTPCMDKESFINVSNSMLERIMPLTRSTNQ